MNAARLSFLAFASLAALTARGKISTTSPFMPAGGAPVITAQTENSAIELRGVMATAEGLVFGIYEPATQKGSWVKLNDTDQPYVVRSYDQSRGAASVEFQGRTETLTLKEAKFDASAPTVAAAPQVQQPPRGDPAIAASPSDEAKRLETVAQEVRRRRAARQAAAAAQQANRPPQPPP
jgi:hypothetical protein